MDHPAPSQGERGFDLFGPDIPERPVILSIPHAGREYPQSLLDKARVQPETLHRLEDRWADLLVEPLIARGYSIVMARAPRALIDLNRHEREIDPGMIVGLPRDVPLHSSAKLRGGLGLMPRRMVGAPELWRGPFDWSDVQARIEGIHRPYHAALADRMQAAREVHGYAILIDVHSMPSLSFSLFDGRPPTLVLGDRFGRSASSRLMACAAHVAASHGLRVGQNHPYAGAYLIERHGRPERDCHAIQMEFDRHLYLDRAMEMPGPGLARTQGALAAMVEALEEELPRRGYALAAE